MTHPSFPPAGCWKTSERSGFRAAARIVVLAAAFAAAACTVHPPVLAPPAAGVEAMEGFGSASIRGAEATVKGKFSFLFRRPGLGRIEALDPFGRTVYTIVFHDGVADLVLPSKRAYVEDRAETMMDRCLGFSLRPDDILRLLSGQWPADEPAGAGVPEVRWTLERGAGGRVTGGARDGFAFTVSEFFEGTGVPRILLFSRAGVSGRLRILSLRFNPLSHPEAFAAPVPGTFVRKSWDDIQEMLRHEN